MTTNRARRPAGIPTGGQFAPVTRPEASGGGLVDDDALPTMAELPDGTREWRRGGQLHRDDGPAVEEPYGYMAWYRNGERIEAPK